MKSDYDIIRRPIITEKATLTSENGGVVFEVSMNSNKAQIKEAVEKLRQPLRKIDSSHWIKFTTVKDRYGQDNNTVAIRFPFNKKVIK